MSSDKIVPVVGMGVTMSIGSDSYPCTVVEVINEKRCIVQDDKQKRVDGNGWSAQQRYLFIPDPDGEKTEIYLSKHGVWRRRGDGGKGSYRYRIPASEPSPGPRQRGPTVQKKHAE